MRRKPTVAFVCVHNSCRSQLAEALGRHFYSDVFDSYSAGTDVSRPLQPDAVRLLLSLYGIDMRERQRPKRIEELPPIDIAITMGCGVVCPSLGSPYQEDWGLVDPSGQSDEVFLAVIATIEEQLHRLADTVRMGQSVE